MFKQIIENVKMNAPLVHNITNYVTVNDCANILLASGSLPIMADEILEVCDIISICNALVINIGTLNERTVLSMMKAGKKANELNLPVILDPVGAGASKLRTDTTFELLSKVKFSVIRGNISEIKTIGKGNGTTKGVDADEIDVVTNENLNDTILLAKDLSKRTGAVIVITGAIDIVANNEKAYVIKNGHYMMGKITGTGCMLSGIIGAFCGANKDTILEAATTAVCAMGLCGEFAYEKMIKNDGGTSSMKMYLIDYMSKVEAKMLEEGAKIESR